MESKESISYWIKNRRSTFLKGFQEGGKISDETIQELLDLAIWAPTHGLSQTWLFKVFTGEGLDSFYRAQQKIYQENTPTERFNHEKYNKFLTKSKYVSHVIAVISKRDPKKRFPQQEDVVSASCAMQNMYLALQSFNIVGYLSTGDICYQPAMRNYLKLEEEDACIGFLTLGIVKKEYSYPQRRRIPASDKTEWIRS